MTVARIPIIAPFSFVNYDSLQQFKRFSCFLFTLHHLHARRKQPVHKHPHIQ